MQISQQLEEFLKDETLTPDEVRELSRVKNNPLEDFFSQNPPQKE